MIATEMVTKGLFVIKQCKNNIFYQLPTRLATKQPNKCFRMFANESYLIGLPANVDNYRLHTFKKMMTTNIGACEMSLVRPIRCPINGTPRVAIGRLIP